jgi:tRNA threonylcarbamoyladenosine biosynthesis protein TsaE
MKRIISESPEMTAELAAEFAKTLKSGDVICLDGDLGVGKTAFVQGLARGLGINGYISSPTFTIVNEYDAPLPLYHFDVYRIADSEEMYDIGFDEYIFGKGVCVIEWSKNISDILPDKRYEITISKDYSKSENYREITIEEYK